MVDQKGYDVYVLFTKIFTVLLSLSASHKAKIAKLASNDFSDLLHLIKTNLCVCVGGGGGGRVFTSPIGQVLKLFIQHLGAY